MKMRRTYKKGMERSTIELLVLTIVILIAAGLYLGGFVPGLQRTAKAATVCKGLCSNQIIKETDATGKEIGGYRVIKTCEEVNEIKKQRIYMPDSSGDCQGGYECCAGLKEYGP